MLSLLGIKKVYVLVNKMDLAGYAETAFVKIKHDMGAFLAELGIYPLKYIPVSGLQGDNIASKSAQMPWYQGEPLLEALDLLEGEQAAVDRALRLPIQDVYKFDSRRIIAGRIEAGQLAVGDEIAIYPGGRKTKVVAFPYWQAKDQCTQAFAGASTGIQVADEFFNQRGEIITRAGDTPPLTGKRLRVSLFWLGKKPLQLNRRYKLKLGTQEVEAQVESIEKLIDASSLDQRAADTVKEIRLNDVAEVILKLKEEIAFDRFQDYQATGRFVLVDGYDVAGGGIVLAAEKEAHGEFSQKAMRYIMNHLPQNGELIVVVKDGEIVRLERTEREVFSGIDGEGI
jgi:bifunctional enzyme CysN/CysC/sulfate adenylyltransferase subunit 1